MVMIFKRERRRKKEKIREMERRRKGRKEKYTGFLILNEVLDVEQIYPKICSFPRK
jgi:hypothetical protein